MSHVNNVLIKLWKYENLSAFYLQTAVRLLRHFLTCIFHNGCYFESWIDKIESKSLIFYELIDEQINIDHRENNCNNL